MVGDGGIEMFVGAEAASFVAALVGLSRRARTLMVSRESASCTVYHPRPRISCITPLIVSVRELSSSSATLTESPTENEANRRLDDD